MISKIKELKKIVWRDSTTPIIITGVVLSTLSALVYKLIPIFNLNENQILYLYSSAAQVIAAIYGLIITGYIFLRNELDRKADKDETLEEVILLIKTENFASIIGISICTIISIGLCFLVISFEKQRIFLLDFLINFSTAAIFTQLVIVGLFVIRILNPNSLELASNKLREITTQDKENEKGSLEEFLRHYNQIEYILDKYGTTLLYPEINNYEDAKRKRIAKTKLVYILYNAGKIDLQLKNNLIELISFRNGLIHGTNLSISSKDEDLSKEVLTRLKRSLGTG